MVSATVGVSQMTPCAVVAAAGVTESEVDVLSEELVLLALSFEVELEALEVVEVEEVVEGLEVDGEPLGGVLLSSLSLSVLSLGDITSVWMSVTVKLAGLVVACFFALNSAKADVGFFTGAFTAAS